ncbi:MAG TPA: type II toxin-antitoxin system VapC family toxin [Puia sp.]|nr:type II toxin-antitoxin system VapC family toxin [Puia sp.]
MTCLLNTHYMIWAITDTKKLSKKLRELLVDPDNRIIVSAISFWEISLKNALGKLSITGFLPEDLPGLCEAIGFEVKPLSPNESCTYHMLKATYHRDPFDRMLIWQAIVNNYTLISTDTQIKKYASEGLKIF